MNAFVSLRNFFGRFNPRHNIYDQYWLMLFISWLFGAVSILFLPFWLGVPCFIVSMFAMAQFGTAARDRLTPSERPWLVRQFDKLQPWWERYSSAISTEIRGDNRYFHVRYDCNFIEIYNTAGLLVGLEQTIDQADGDPDWEYGQPREVYTVCYLPTNPHWLSRLALMRTRRLARSRNY
jgi:hypothetical protein